MSKSRIDKNIQLPDSILRQLLTPSEMRMIKNRFQIMNLLEEGLSIRKVANQVKVGTDTVVRVARLIERTNLKTPKQVQSLSFKSSTPWIFGKNS